jgi:hypothetical protein
MTRLGYALWQKTAALPRPSPYRRCHRGATAALCQNVGSNGNNDDNMIMTTTTVAAVAAVALKTMVVACE